jgi:tetratricopeptide (TPR) repeat protein
LLGVKGTNYPAHWSVSAFLIPVLNLYWPPKVVSEIARGSDPRALGPREWQGLSERGHVKWWWRAFFASFVVNYVQSKADTDIGAFGAILAYGLAMASEVLAIMLVLEIDAMQREKQVLLRTGAVPTAPSVGFVRHPIGRIPSWAKIGAVFASVVLVLSLLGSLGLEDEPSYSTSQASTQPSGVSEADLQELLASVRKETEAAIEQPPQDKRSRDGSTTAPDAAHAELARYLDRGDHEDAAAYLERYLVEMPSDVKAWLLLGDCYDRLGRWKKAVEAHDAALEVKPDCSEACMGRGYSLLDGAAYDEAVEAFRRAARLEPISAEAQGGLGLAYYYARQYDESTTSFRKAVSLEPTSPIYHHNLGMALSGKGMYRAAIAAFTRSLKLDPSGAKTWVRRGSAYHELGQHLQAVSDLSKAIALDPSDADAFHYRGLCWTRQADPSRAIEDLSKAIGLRPKDPSIFFARGSVHESKGSDGPAMLDYRKASELDPAGECGRLAREALERLRGEIDLPASGDRESLRPSVPTRREDARQELRPQSEPRVDTGADGSQQDEAYERVLRKVKAFEDTGVYDAGYKALVTDPDYRRYRDVPRFKALGARLRAKADALEKETGRRDAF